MEPTATRPSLIAACLDRQMLLQRIGLLIFLASMPLDVLNGHGKGMIADPDHFQGWEVAWLGIYFSSWLFDGELSSVVFFPFAVTTAFTLTMPFVDLSKPGVGTRIARILKTIGAASLSFTAFFLWQWYRDRDDFRGQAGAFWGAVPWLVGPALVVVGTLRQKPQKAPARRSWSFSLRTLFIVVTAIALLAAAVGTYDVRPGPVVLFAILVGVMVAAAFLRVAEPAPGQMPDDRRSGDSPAP